MSIEETLLLAADPDRSVVLSWQRDTLFGALGYWPVKNERIFTRTDEALRFPLTKFSVREAVFANV